MAKIFIVSASGVKNLELAQEFEAKLVSLGAEVTLLNLVELNLPFYTSLIDAHHNAKDLFGTYYDALLSADGFVFVSPEYNGGFPPTFPNFLAWVSRSTKNWRDAFNFKPVAIASHSGGGSQVLTMMRLQLAYIGMNVLGRQISVNTNKPLERAALDDLCQQLLKVSHQ